LRRAFLSTQQNRQRQEVGRTADRVLVVAGLSVKTDLLAAVVLKSFACAFARALPSMNLCHPWCKQFVVITQNACIQGKDCRSTDFNDYIKSQQRTMGARSRVAKDFGRDPPNWAKREFPVKLIA